MPMYGLGVVGVVRAFSMEIWSASNVRYYILGIPSVQYSLSSAIERVAKVARVGQALERRVHLDRSGRIWQ